LNNRDSDKVLVYKTHLDTIGTKSDKSLIQIEVTIIVDIDRAYERINVVFRVIDTVIAVHEICTGKHMDVDKDCVNSIRYFISPFCCRVYLTSTDQI